MFIIYIVEFCAGRGKQIIPLIPKTIGILVTRVRDLFVAAMHERSMLDC